MKDKSKKKNKKHKKVGKPLVLSGRSLTDQTKENPKKRRKNKQHKKKRQQINSDKTSAEVHNSSEKKTESIKNTPHKETANMTVNSVNNDKKVVKLNVDKGKPEKHVKDLSKTQLKKEKVNKTEAGKKNASLKMGPSVSKIGQGKDSASGSENKLFKKKQLKRIKWKQKQQERKLERMKNKTIGGKKKVNLVNASNENKDKAKKKKKLSHSKENRNVQKDKQEVKDSAPSEVSKKENKISVPKTAAEATCNWKRLQMELSVNKKSVKRKHPPENIKSKHRKTENIAKEMTANEPEIWFDDVDEILLDRRVTTVAASTPKTDDSNAASTEGPANVKNPLVKDDAYKGVTKAVAMDCEMVGVGDGTDSVLARVSIVNQYGEPVYDKFVKPKETVVDYRTHVSGVRAQDLENAESFEVVQKEVADILRGRMLVGHAIVNDLKVLYLGHPKRMIRDTSRYKKFRQVFGGRTPSLKKLSDKVLAVKVQEGEHNSIQDAQAAMRLYTMYRKQWEADIREKRFGKKKSKPTGNSASTNG